ncbi:MAG: hypothetical protein ACW96M_02245 [Candidatus Thorarchaeota archaeon]|jgi:hypothetical protein
MQNGLLPLIRLDLIFEVISGIIALVVTIYATRAYNLTGQKRLQDLSTGFLVLSAGMFGRVIGTWYFVIQLGIEGPSSSDILAIVTVAYGASRIMAYILFVVATRPARHREPMNNENLNGNGISLLIAATILVDPNLEVIAILVLIWVVIQAVNNYLSTRSELAFFVLLGFFLILLSHILVAQTLTNPTMYLSSQLAQLLGFLSLLVMLFRAGRVE